MASGQLPNPLLKSLQRLGSHTPLGSVMSGEAQPKERALPRAIHRCVAEVHDQAVAALAQVRGGVVGEETLKLKLASPA